jgi:hypothetical protein
MTGIRVTKQTLLSKERRISEITKEVKEQLKTNKQETHGETERLCRGMKETICSSNPGWGWGVDGT